MINLCHKVSLIFLESLHLLSFFYSRYCKILNVEAQMEFPL